MELNQRDSFNGSARKRNREHNMLKYSYSRVENNVKKEGRSEKHKYCKESSRHLEQDDFSFYIAFNLCISSFSLSDKEANP